MANVDKVWKDSIYGNNTENEAACVSLWHWKHFLVKYCALCITKDRCWTKHIDTIIVNCCRKLFFLRGSLRTSTPSVCILAYKTKTPIRPVSEYAVVIWDPLTKSNVRKLENLEKQTKNKKEAVRFVYNIYGRISVTNLICERGLASVTTRNRICRLKFFLSTNKRPLQYRYVSTFHLFDRLC